jgi:hypothetical protein
LIKKNKIRIAGPKSTAAGFHHLVLASPPKAFDYEPYKKFWEVSEPFGTFHTKKKQEPLDILGITHYKYSRGIQK